MSVRPSRAHRTYFTFAITCISQYMILRDRVFGLSKKGRQPVGIHERALRRTLPALPASSMRYLLSRSLSRRMRRFCSATASAKPSSNGSVCSSCSPPMAWRLWCLTTRAMATAPAGPIGISLKQDAVAAFAALRDHAPYLPVSVLGFSLGSGVAAAAIHQLNAHRLVLCEAFTSFRNAAAAAMGPQGLTHLVPPIWHAQQPLADCSCPSSSCMAKKTGCFPAKMAHELAGWCSPARNPADSGNLAQPALSHVRTLTTGDRSLRGSANSSAGLQTGCTCGRPRPR